MPNSSENVGREAEREEEGGKEQTDSPEERFFNVRVIHIFFGLALILASQKRKENRNYYYK